MAYKRTEWIGWDGTFGDPIIIDLNCVEWHFRASLFDPSVHKLNGVAFVEFGTILDPNTGIYMFQLDVMPTFDANGDPVPYIDRLYISTSANAEFNASLITVHHVA